MSKVTTTRRIKQYIFSKIKREKMKTKDNYFNSTEVKKELKEQVEKIFKQTLK